MLQVIQETKPQSGGGGNGVCVVCVWCGVVCVCVWCGVVWCVCVARVWCVCVVCVCVWYVWCGVSLVFNAYLVHDWCRIKICALKEMGS